MLSNIVDITVDQDESGKLYALTNDGEVYHCQIPIHTHEAFSCGIMNYSGKRSTLGLVQMKI